MKHSVYPINPKPQAHHCHSTRVIRQLSLQLFQLVQSCRNDFLAGLFNLACKEDFVQDGVNLVEVKYEVKFANVFEEGV